MFSTRLTRPSIFFKEHPELGGCVKRGYSVSLRGREPLFDVVSPVDHFGHGTACAGIIHELAPKAELISIQVLGATCRGYVESFLAGLDVAMRERSQLINLSLGSLRQSYAPLFHARLDTAFFQNQLVVAAASNTPPPTLPSTLSPLVSVDCADEAGPDEIQRSHASRIQFSAHGTDVLVPWKGGARKVVTGTSFAAARVTGLLARMLSRLPGLPLPLVRAALLLQSHQ